MFPFSARRYGRGFAYQGLSTERLNPSGRFLMETNQWDIVLDKLRDLAFADRSSITEVSQDTLKALNT